MNGRCTSVCRESDFFQSPAFQFNHETITVFQCQWKRSDRIGEQIFKVLFIGENGEREHLKKGKKTLNTEYSKYFYIMKIQVSDVLVCH